VGTFLTRMMLVTAAVGALVAGGAAGRVPAGTAGAAPWPTYRDDTHRFSIALPASWLPAARFLASPGFARFARRHPLFADEYRALVRRARGRFALLAFDASDKALRDADSVGGRSYGLFPTIFVVLTRSDPLLPEIHDEVVPSGWGGGGPGKQGCSLDKNSREISRRREISCGFLYETDRGRLLTVESRAAGKPPRRPWIVVGLAFAHATKPIDAAGDEPNRTYQAAWHTVRYL
jgi:hypothetical protein